MDPENPETKSDYFQTPNIERLMDMGMRFTQGSASATSNSSKPGARTVSNSSTFQKISPKHTTSRPACPSRPKNSTR
jgi:arylsulfatase A-like enzyme